MKFLVILILFTMTLSISFGATNPAPRNEWSIQDHWETTNLSLQGTIFRNINQVQCSKSAKDLIACLATVNRAVEFIYPNKKIIAEFKPEEVESEYAPFVLIDYSNLSNEEFFKKEKSYYHDMARQFSPLYKTNITSYFSIDKIMAKLMAEIIYEGNDQYIAGMLYNEYLIFSIDPHTYLKPVSMFNQEEQIPSPVRRLGLSYERHIIKNEEVILILYVEPKSPAEKAGIKAGDIVKSINGVSNLDEMNTLIDDQELIDFDFTLLRDKETLDILVSKDFITVTNVVSKVLTRDNKKYGHILLTDFMQDGTCESVKQAGLQMINKDKISGLILDLRGNPGGRNTTANCLLNLFLEDGSITSSKEYIEVREYGAVTSKLRRTDNIFGQIHTATLINGRSASASELTAMALKDYRKSFIVGERSFGKGSMQQVRQVSDTLMHATTFVVYYGPSGVSPQLNGVLPDFEVYESINQTEPTKFQREEDKYFFPLKSSVSEKELVAHDRKKEIEEINSCRHEKQSVVKRFENLSQAYQILFDYQLENAIEILDCANEKIEIFNNIDIPVVESLNTVTPRQFKKLLNQS